MSFQQKGLDAAGPFPGEKVALPVAGRKFVPHWEGRRSSSEATVGLVGGAHVPSVTSRRASLQPQQEKHPTVTSGRQALGSRDRGAVPTWDPLLLLRCLLLWRKVMGSNAAFHRRLAAIKRRRKRCSATLACQSITPGRRSLERGGARGEGRGLQQPVAMETPTLPVHSSVHTSLKVRARSGEGAAAAAVTLRN